MLRRALATLTGQSSTSRGQDRWRRAGLTGVTSASYQVIVLGTGLAALPLTVNYLGGERYGVWLTLSSLLTWLSISDLGLGSNALINALAEAAAREDKRWQKELTATAFWALALIAGCLGALIFPIFWSVRWATVFNVSSAVTTKELEQAIAISLVAFLLEFPVRVSVAVYHGNQEGYISNSWSILGSVLSLIALVCVTRGSGGLPQLALALWGTRLLVSVAAATYLFLWHRPWLAPAPRAVTRRAFNRLGSLGLRYVLAQLGGFGIMQSQPLIISQMADPSAVAVFSVTQRIAFLPSTFVLMFLTPLMPAYGEARGRNDWTWIRETYRRSAVLAAGACLVSASGLLLFLRPVVRLWLGTELEPPVALVSALSAYVFLGGLISPMSVMLYGFERVGRQAIIALANGLAVVILGVFGTHLWGLAGMGASMLVAAMITNLPGQLLEARSALAQDHAGSKTTG